MTVEVLRRGVVLSENGCWLWQRTLKDAGYGYIKYEGKGWFVHRLAWTLVNGPIPDGLEVDHICYVRNCLNPEHLQLATHQENSARRRNALGATCRAGHDLVPPNLYVAPGTRKRKCRICRSNYSHARYVARKAG
jgi:hypothetical protein